jgi:hypothetical protein
MKTTTFQHIYKLTFSMVNSKFRTVLKHPVLVSHANTDKKKEVQYIKRKYADGGWKEGLLFALLS